MVVDGLMWDGSDSAFNFEISNSLFEHSRQLGGLLLRDVANHKITAPPTGPRGERQIAAPIRAKRRVPRAVVDDAEQDGRASSVHVGDRTQRRAFVGEYKGYSETQAGSATVSGVSLAPTLAPTALNSAACSAASGCKGENVSFV